MLGARRGTSDWPWLRPKRAVPRPDLHRADGLSTMPRGREGTLTAQQCAGRAMCECPSVFPAVFRHCRRETDSSQDNQGESTWAFVTYVVLPRQTLRPPVQTSSEEGSSRPTLARDQIFQSSPRFPSILSPCPGYRAGRRRKHVVFLCTAWVMPRRPEERNPVDWCDFGGGGRRNVVLTSSQRQF